MEPTSIEKIVEIDSHIACAFSGLTADSKTLIDRARVESQNHWFTYDEKMQVESVAQAVSNLAIPSETQMTMLESCPDHLVSPFSLLVLMRMVPSCTTWTRVAHIYSLMPRPLAVVVRELSNLSRKLTTKV